MELLLLITFPCYIWTRNRSNRTYLFLRCRKLWKSLYPEDFFLRASHGRYFKNTMTFHLFSRLLFKPKKVSFRSMSNKIENAFPSWHSVFLLPPPPLIHLLILIVLLNFPSSTNTERQLLLTVDSYLWYIERAELLSK